MLFLLLSHQAQSSKLQLVLKPEASSQAPVAHTYNPNYSGGRDQEDCSSKPARSNISKGG
jgi:hypothetical protein